MIIVPSLLSPTRPKEMSAFRASDCDCRTWLQVINKHFLCPLISTSVMNPEPLLNPFPFSVLHWECTQIGLSAVRGRRDTHYSKHLYKAAGNSNACKKRLHCNLEIKTHARAHTHSSLDGKLNEDNSTRHQVPVFVTDCPSANIAHHVRFLLERCEFYS